MLFSNLFASFCFLAANINNNFNNYVHKYNKNYDGIEYRERLEIYETNMKFINKHNMLADEGKYTYWLGETQFTDISNEEFRNSKQVGKLTNISSTCNIVSKYNGSVPDHKNWLEYGIVSSVKNQAQCGSCWAFSATEAVEGVVSLRKGELISLSEQQMVDCSDDYGNQGCGGGWMDSAFEYVIDNKGLCSNASYQYTAQDGTCNTNCSLIQNTDIKNCSDISPNIEELVIAYLSQQPLSVAIEADSDTFQHYKRGLYNDSSCFEGGLDHGVLLVSYGPEMLRIKNSWDTTWGEDGFMRMARTGDGDGMCGIYNKVSFPTF